MNWKQTEIPSVHFKGNIEYKEVECPLDFKFKSFYNHLSPSKTEDEEFLKNKELLEQLKKCFNKENGVYTPEVIKRTEEQITCTENLKNEFIGYFQNEVISNNLLNVKFFKENILSCEKEGENIIAILQFNDEQCILRLGTKTLEE